MKRFILAALLLSTTLVLADPPPAPTIADGKYADTPGCEFDFWQAKAPDAPLVILIHGGGFIRGTRKDMYSVVTPALDRGYAVMTLDYPFLPAAPVQQILHLCARAVQYARHNAAAWKIDPHRIICLGGSAGAGTSLWLAVHPDLADPNSADPVAKESTRISGIGLLDTQSTYNMFAWKDAVGFNDDLAKMKFFSPVQLYHFPTNEMQDTPEARAMLKDVDMLAMIDATTPPIVMRTKQPDVPPATPGAFVHHPRHDLAIQARAKPLGVWTDYTTYDAKGPNGYVIVLDALKDHIKPTP